MHSSSVHWGIPELYYLTSSLQLTLSLSLSKTMERITIVLILFLATVVHNSSAGSCSSLEESCRESSECCPLVNGKAYCNGATRQCEAARFCSDGDLCPFNDLSTEEVNSVVGIIRASSKFSHDIQFPIIRSQEPTKAIWNGFKTKVGERLAFAAVFDMRSNLLSTVTVDLGQRSILSIEPQPNKLPPLLHSEDLEAQAMFFKDPRVKEAYERRGLNFSYAKCESWVLGAIGSQGHPPGKRLVTLVTFYQPPEASYYDWHPIEGLEMTVDLNSKTVYSFTDDTAIPSPSNFKLLTDTATTLRKSDLELKPLRITQPEGSSIQVNGEEISWYKWKFQYAMDSLNGLKLYHVRYNGDCEERLILYKISISEMFVPYGDTGGLWRWRNPFDAGEYGLGRLSTPLELGIDVPENALLFNCTMADDTTGEPVVKQACIGVYERDGGILYKHTSDDGKSIHGKRGRDLVITFSVAIGNYDYAFEYIFKMDGSMDVNVKLTGITLPRGVSSVKNDATCIDSCLNLVNNNLVTPIHQHFFNYRMDFDVDGPLNSVLEVDVVGNSGKSGLRANLDAFSAKKKLIKTETGRDWKLERSRSWHIVNPNSRNKFGSMRGYAITPATTIAHSFLNPEGLIYPQAQFVTHPFWVTVYKDDEQGAAGLFPRSGDPGQGLPTYISNRESLENTDVVAWYTVGITHIPRPEEWPIMNAHDAGFHVTPVNFMSQNPEVPVSPSQC